MPTPSTYPGFHVIATIAMIAGIAEKKKVCERSDGNPGGYAHTLRIRVYAAQRGRGFETPDLERGIHFRGAFQNRV